MINYLYGDATQPQGHGNKIISHICNDLGAWGAGFVLAVTRRWPDARTHYLNWSTDLDAPQPFELGVTQFVQVADDVVVANMIAQHGIHPHNGEPPIRYWALELCLATVATYALTHNATVHMPRIGCGLAGGQWNIVERVISAHLVARNIDVVVYDLPPDPSAPP